MKKDLITFKDNKPYAKITVLECEGKRIAISEEKPAQDSSYFYCPRHKVIGTRFANDLHDDQDIIDVDTPLPIGTHLALCTQENKNYTIILPLVIWEERKSSWQDFRLWYEKEFEETMTDEQVERLNNNWNSPTKINQ